MGFGNSRSVRFEDDLELPRTSANSKSESSNGIKLKYHIDGTQIAEASSNKKAAGNNKKFLKGRVLSRVFSEDYERVKRRRILDPRGQAIHRWNKIFLVASLVSLFVDPLFFYLPVVQDEVCIDIGITLEVVLTFIRTVGDAFYMIQIFTKFRTAYVAPSSRVFGRGELVIDTSKIAVKYLFKEFWLDFLAALPLPQVP
ncbi:Protein CNGC15c [Stylosanthes scabra]|uniref:Protein CNGC15c n=1 Tax=Stylosanthes scabra TaxID=79078 RepID=A0ABU6RVL3_9FABA|nr:Protein CNGC15c [Stylosanthes scabra]